MTDLTANFLPPIPVRLRAELMVAAVKIAQQRLAAFGTKEGYCMYKTGSGSRCLIGQIVAPMYNDDLEGRGAHTTELRRVVGQVTGTDISEEMGAFMSYLQHEHDNAMTTTLKSDGMTDSRQSNRVALKKLARKLMRVAVGDTIHSTAVLPHYQHTKQSAELVNAMGEAIIEELQNTASLDDARAYAYGG